MILLYIIDILAIGDLTIFLFKHFKWKVYAFSITPKGQKQNGRTHLLNNGGVRSGRQKLAFKKKFLRTQHCRTQVINKNTFRSGRVLF